jgi:hypothetical protein
LEQEKNEKEEKKMILQSLITDARRISFDCCKKTMAKNDSLELPDSLYQNAEIQGAIKLGFVKLVGNTPIAYEAATIVRLKEKRIKNISTLKIGLDCIKGTVMPGQTVTITEDKFVSLEVQNALSMGVLMDLDNPTQLVDQLGPFEPAVLNELTNADIKATPAKKTAIKKVNDGVTMGEEDDPSDNFYKPSEILSPKAKVKGKVNAPVAHPVQQISQASIDETMQAIEGATTEAPPSPSKGNGAASSEKQEEDPLSFLFEN